MTEVAVDACCLINLCAAGRILAPGRPPEDPSPRRKGGGPSLSAEIHPLDLTLHVPEHVRREALRLDRPDPDDPSKCLSMPLDLESLIEQGLIHPCRLDGDEEIRRFVEFAAELDDGESACLAIAVHRGWMLGSDDRVAARMADSLGVQVLTTEQLVKRWADSTGPSAIEIAEVLAAIEIFGHDVPRRTSPLRDWWREHGRRS